MTKIDEIAAEGKCANVEGTIIFVGEIQKTPAGAENRECILQDDSGQIKLVLWDAQVNQFKKGDKVILPALWVKRFPREGGDFQISTGKFGKIVKQ